ncbi:hypothetical protein [Pseudoalteromonas phenolica]|uniref:hypothetical protein n=1 Tax=Pseudoalteromonas phenolica TaxID=161398 RepID=UPI000717811B|nr:hypothetical protein [Pseudoalteromonas phenolica]MBE0357123.1 hypothetical protein [Pseudoalteromonas phenolica O-BC30]RXE93384.1 hypothetical protein D9981_20605 [Pseudoalteromonas phenolica O-BC30]
MNKQSSDDELIKLYQQNNDAMPPKHIDDAILARAADAVNGENRSIDNVGLESKARARKATKTSSRWWQYSGLAAAIVTVAVLAPWQYYQDPMLVSVESVEVPAMPKAKQAQESTSQIERVEILAEDVQMERIEVTGARIGRAVPEQKARAVQAVSPVMYGINLSEPNAKPNGKFKDILAKLENKDEAGAQSALIKLLKEKPEYHDDIPEPLEDLYQALLKSGKIERPETSSKSDDKSKDKN